MKKQIQMILLALLLSAGVTACGGNKSNNDQGDSTSSSGASGVSDSAANNATMQADTNRTDSAGMRDTTAKP